ncbi:MAG: Uma2 family endonuclease [Acidobacteria bacterium]|nr:Uma2 family endonuclease [Acidobacteriota bacterium]
MSTATVISPEEFLAIADQEEAILEYDDGLVQEASDSSVRHGAVQTMIGHEVILWSKASGADIVASCNPGFWLTGKVLRKPDLAIIRPDVLALMPPYRGHVLGCPEIAVEVISDNESVGRIERKTRQYLESGAIAVWNIYPESQIVVVWRQRGAPYVASRTGFLEGPELLPGLRIPVAGLFTGR